MEKTEPEPNDKRFGADLNVKLSSRLLNLHSWQSQLLGYMAQYLAAANDQQQAFGCNAFLNLLDKIAINLDSVGLLLPALHRDYSYKASVNVLYRAIIDDIINSYYLFCTVVPGDPKQHALINELNILHKEFLLGVVEGVKAEHDFRAYLDTLENKKPAPAVNVEETVKKANPELVDQEGKWKNNGVIRATTHPDISKLLKQSDNSTFITEAKKLDFLKASGIPLHDQLKSIFKYLSQYQHFSPRAHDMLNSHIEQDISMYQHSLAQLMTLLRYLFMVLKLKNKDELEHDLNLLSDSMMNSFKRRTKVDCTLSALAARVCRAKALSAEYS